MWAMIVKEFLQLRRDKRTLAMMIVLPVVMLVVFGYAASFDVSKIPALVVGPKAASYAKHLRAPFSPVTAAPRESVARAKEALQDGSAEVVFVAGEQSVQALIDGADLFSAQATRAAIARQAQPQALLQSFEKALPPGHAVLTPIGALPPKVDILYNPGLKTAVVMVPGLAGVILVFIGTLIASLSVVRERQAGTLEQHAGQEHEAERQQPDLPETMDADFDVMRDQPEQAGVTQHAGQSAADAHVRCRDPRDKAQRDEDRKPGTCRRQRRDAPGDEHGARRQCHPRGYPRGGPGRQITHITHPGNGAGKRHAATPPRTRAG